MVVKRASKQRYTPKNYRDGAEGCIKWIEDNICVPIYPEGSVIEQWVPIKHLPTVKNPVTGKTYKGIWDAQKEILRKALIMKNGNFVYNQIVFCWMRGEGKSLLACIIQLWKFFCWPRQKIMLGANSKEQIKFVHFDIMRDIIRNSPALFRAVGEKNIQEKEIRMLNRKGELMSMIRSIATSSGIVSNITGYTFSEIFAMKNPVFYVQLDGSIRNIPNAIGVIDSTVSEKKHTLYNLYEGARDGKTRKVFFSYRCSKDADPDDYWNPKMDEAQLNDYQYKFPFGEFERYFKNIWSAGTIKVFSSEIIEEMECMGVDGTLLNHKDLSEAIQEKYRLKEQLTDTKGKGFLDTAEVESAKIVAIDERIKRVENFYTIGNRFGLEHFISVEKLNELSKLLDTDWAIMSGLDMADPMAVLKKAKSVLTFWAKGLPGSKTDVSYLTMDKGVLKYIYLLVGIAHIKTASTDEVKEVMELAHDELEIDTFCSERYGSWDMVKWCEEREIQLELISPNYDRQRDAFKEFYNAANEGRIKKPPLFVPGMKEKDILNEELSVFDHDPDKRWFGSPHKDEKYGIQDDSIYSSGWCLYGGRMLGPEDFRERGSIISFGNFYENKHLVGKYA